MDAWHGARTADQHDCLFTATISVVDFFETSAWPAKRAQLAAAIGTLTTIAVAFYTVLTHIVGGADESVGRTGPAFGSGTGLNRFHIGLH